MLGILAQVVEETLVILYFWHNVCAEELLNQILYVAGPAVLAHHGFVADAFVPGFLYSSGGFPHEAAHFLDQAVDLLSVFLVANSG